jgi:hypothetical protein
MNLYNTLVPLYFQIKSDSVEIEFEGYENAKHTMAKSTLTIIHNV